MSQNHSISAVACAPGALPGGPVRTRFFDGMFLTQADLENEQRFWRLKRRLTNRALGEGVVWGLRVGWNAARRSFNLSPGYALDCCGNDLIVECPVEVAEAELLARLEPVSKATSVKSSFVTAAAAERAAKTRQACLVLQYVECAEDARPVHRDACAGTAGYCEPSRVRETARLLLAPPPRRRPTPPEQLLEELEALKKNLPATLRDALFPAQAAPAPAPVPSAGLVPLRVRVSVPGAPAPAVSELQPGLAGSTVSGTPAVLTAKQAVNPDRRSGVVTFELRADPGWGFSAGRVLDQTRVVETVTPPVAPSMYWSLDLALPKGADSAESTFAFDVDALRVDELFAGPRQGVVQLRVTGSVRVVGADQGPLDVTLRELRVSTLRAEVAAGRGEPGCLDELVPWGLSVDPRRGGKLASVLVLSALYAFLGEVVRHNGSPTWQRIALLVYTLGWYALFGALPIADVPDEERKKLSQLIVDLYKRWCEGMAYAGPHCADELHGVYLGCAEIDASGRVLSFDMWEHRRYVVTGALLGHWAEQLGFAPLDVVAGRFARAVCCLSGLPAWLPPRLDGRLPGVLDASVRQPVHVGTRVSAAEFAKVHGAELQWVPVAELARRALPAFAGSTQTRVLDVLATQIESGAVVALAVPRASGPNPDPKFEAVRADVLGLVRRGELRTQERSRPLVAEFALGTLERAPLAALVGDAPAPTRELTKQLSARGLYVADVLAAGTEGLTGQLTAPSAQVREATDDLVDRAEQALDALVAATVHVLGPRFDREAVRGAAPKLAAAITKSALPKLDKQIVLSAAERVARGP